MTPTLKNLAATIRAEREYWVEFARKTRSRDERYYGAMGALENLAYRIAETTEWKLLAHRAEFWVACGY